MVSVFPAPKRGKRRVFTTKAAGATKKKNNMVAAGKKSKLSKTPFVPYVRHGTKTAVSRPSQCHWNRDVFELKQATDKQIIDMLTKDKQLPNWKGKTCPFCGVGKVMALANYKKKGWQYKCGRKACKRFIKAHAFHPIYQASGKGPGSTPLQTQAAVLFALISGASQATTHKLFKKNHKMIERLSRSNDEARKKFITKNEKAVSFGNGTDWMDAEADEVDVTNDVDPDPEDSSKPVSWEQWGGLVMRGFPRTLILKRLCPCKTKLRAPGPGPIRKRDWKPFAKKYIEGKKIVLHSDGARSYKLKLRNVLHDQAIHKKKKVVVNGVAKWVNPKYSKIIIHEIENKQKLYVKSGTQIIDRFWSHLRTHLGRMKRTTGSKTLEARIRSAQFTYWYKREDLWMRTGDMLQDSRA